MTEEYPPSLPEQKAAQDGTPKVLSIIEAQENHVAKRWDQMTLEEQEAYQKHKQEVDDTYNKYASNINNIYRNPSRFVNRNQRTHTKNIYSKLFKPKEKKQ
jgi:hypothetical protein